MQMMMVKICRPTYTDDCDQLENPDGVSCNQADRYRTIDGRLCDIKLQL